MKKGNPWALLPIGVFLAVYLGLGLTFEYIMKIEMGFYNVPIIIAFLIAILVACLQNRKVSFEDKLELMGRGVGDKNIITMLLIFLVAAYTFSVYFNAISFVLSVEPVSTIISSLETLSSNFFNAERQFSRCLSSFFTIIPTVKII